MIFNSFSFVTFFLAVLLVIGVTDRFVHNTKIRNVLLLIASYYLYGTFHWGFLLILLFVTAINYVAPLAMKRYENKRKLICATAIVLSLLPLFTYKYLNFFLTGVLGLEQIQEQWTWLSRLVLPVGISFFTFQALTYTIDVYRGKIESRKNVIDVALFVSFFPTVLSGPIEKARNLLPQIEKPVGVSLRAITEGATIFVYGLFKKVVIADRLASYVDWAYGSYEYMQGGTLALAAIFYSIQIYCDFSGYSDMAWGVAKCLGFNITRNFNFPYFATSIKEFWHRWHISLTSWFTEYVYFSLGGNRVRLKVRWVFNISMVFILSGIWHGAAWNFLIWGCLHAVYYLIEHFLGLQKKGFELPKWLKLPSSIVVFALVTLAWIFFRVGDMGQAAGIIQRIFTYRTFSASVGASTFTFVCNMALLVTFALIEILVYKKLLLTERKGTFCTWGNALLTVALLLMIALFGMQSDSFVYFQF